MLKLIAGNDRAIAAYSRANQWTPLGTGRYADEHGGAVHRLFQAEGLWGMTATNAKLLVLVPDDEGGAPRPMSQNVRAILTMPRGAASPSSRSRSPHEQQRLDDRVERARPGQAGRYVGHDDGPPSVRSYSSTCRRKLKTRTRSEDVSTGRHVTHRKPTTSARSCRNRS